MNSLFDNNIINENDKKLCVTIFCELIEAEKYLEDKIPRFPINFNNFVDYIKNKLNSNTDTDENIKIKLIKFLDYMQKYAETNNINKTTKIKEKYMDGSVIENTHQIAGKRRSKQNTRQKKKTLLIITKSKKYRKKKSAKNNKSKKKTK